MQTNDTISIAKTISIRAAGFNEFWLQEQICKNPSILQLGELEVVYKERIQTSGRRLDILLKDPDDDKMFEVEVMLGESDETHIVRTIAYWDAEQRKFPQRQHFAVLVAEQFDRNFFNVIYRFSHSIPIIAIQVNLLEMSGQQALHLSKIIDTYQEPEDSLPTAREECNESYWRNESAWTLETAKTFLTLIKPVLPDAHLHFTQSRIVIFSNNRGYGWVYKRANEKACFYFWISPKFIQQAVGYLEKTNLKFGKKNKPDGYEISFNADSATLKSNAAKLVRLTQLTKASYEE